MYNNKGQSLVLFIIILPLLLLMLIIIIDIGKFMFFKQKLDSVSEIVLDYGLDKLNDIFNNEKISNINIDDVKYIEKELADLVDLNMDNIDIVDVKIDNNSIYIYLCENMDGVFSKLINISIFSIESSYVGYIDNNKKRIERVSGD